MMSPNISKGGRFYAHAPTSIFGTLLSANRLRSIVRLIQRSSVLDLGCGRGDYWRSCDRTVTVSSWTRTQPGDVLFCCGGIGCCAGRPEFGSQSVFRLAVRLIVLRIRCRRLGCGGLIMEMLRVGRRSIVSFPNFAYYKLRKMLNEQEIAHNIRAAPA